MPGVILAVLDHPRSALRVLEAAGCLADLIGGGHVNALVVRAPPESTVLAGEELLTQAMASRARSAEAERAASLKGIFDGWIPRELDSGITAQWIDVEALAHDVVEDRGAGADFIVIERPAQQEYGTTAQAIHAALFRTDRPVLVVPPDWTGIFGRRIAIAWRDDKRTIKAVLSATRCLRRAERLDVIAGIREDGRQPVMPAILVEHEVDAVLHILPIGSGVFGEAL